ncbi:MAG: SAM-dependent methyltransferase [Saprospiraceae bacterium]|nr:SAM-dependent methyltransferase [Lewinella sp.]
MSVQSGKLYLIPAPLGEGAVHTLPAYTIDVLHSLNYFIAERAKTARHFIKDTQPVKAFSELHFSELNKRTDPSELSAMLQPARDGHDMGLLSEAGCPGVADPGARIVGLAHDAGIEVVPLVGPSSILLALMASGMNGQSFAFHGYLPPKRPDLARELKNHEQLASRLKQTQIFIETPYRNQAFIETALESLRPDTLFGIAADLTLPSQYTRTRRVSDWKQNPPPDLHKRPAIFLVYRG